MERYEGKNPSSDFNDTEAKKGCIYALVIPIVVLILMLS